MFILGILHDIGYEYSSVQTEHPKIGGNLLRRQGYKYWQEVYYHGRSYSLYSSLPLQLLNTADLHTDGKWNIVWDEEQDAILDYELDIYLCEGTEAEKLDWFRTINIAGEKLTDQELRNVVYHGPFVTDAKRYFSKTGCPAYQIGSDYMNGTPIRQDYLETAIKWISKGNIEDYMGKNQHKEDAKELWEYFESVIKWIKKVFLVYRKEMKGLPWGPLYDEFKDLVNEENFDSEEIEDRIKKLMKDEDIKNKRGIYQYILNGEEKHLNIRTFSQRQKRTAYEQQNGICVKCEDKFDIGQMEADHIIPWF